MRSFNEVYIRICNMSSKRNNSHVCAVNKRRMFKKAWLFSEKNCNFCQNFINFFCGMQKMGISQMPTKQIHCLMSVIIQLSRLQGLYAPESS
jgi:hypothetical protein